MTIQQKTFAINSTKNRVKLKIYLKNIIIGAIFACAAGYLVQMLQSECCAATYYVTTNGSSISPYTNWYMAGTSIIDVVNAAMTNAVTRVVCVSNGTYRLTNQVSVTNALTIRSVNGRDATIVDGNYPAYTNRCFYLSSIGAVLDGFTITNGYVIGVDGTGAGAGVDARAGTIIRNCRIIGCVSSNISKVYNAGGAGVYLNGGIVTNCEVMGNISYSSYGGGIYMRTGIGLVINCIIAGNTLFNGFGLGEAYGGGIYAEGASQIIVNCDIYGNTNIASNTGIGGGVGLRDGAIVRNSLVHHNIARYGGGVAANYSYGTIQNCTIVSNSCSVMGGGIFVTTSGAKTTCVENVVSYFNTGSDSNISIYFGVGGAYTGACHIINSCIAPTNTFPTNGIVNPYYANNIEINPRFAGKDVNDWRLTSGSPCVNTGTNQSWMTGAVDLGGHSRIDRFSGRVDMGCYEYLPSGTMCSVP